MWNDWISKTVCWLKEARYRRVYIMIPFIWKRQEWYTVAEHRFMDSSGLAKIWK